MQLMKHFLFIVSLAIACASLVASEPLALHSENPHYFVFRGKPTVLITSAEHYGAVLNRDFDDEKYLAERQYPDKTPGGGNVGFREQMSILAKFMNGFDFLRMKPDEAVVQGGLPAKGRARALSEPGKQYALYFFGGPSAKPSLALPSGKYEVQWLSPMTGKVLHSETITTEGNAVELASPEFDPDIALRIRRDGRN